MSVELLYLPNYSAQNVIVTLKLILAHHSVRGETGGTWITQRPLLSFSSTNATGSFMQTWLIFFQCNSFLQWNSNVLKIHSKFFEFCQKFHQFWFLEARRICFLLSGSYCIVQWDISEGTIKLDFIKGNFSKNGNSWFGSAIQRTEKNPNLVRKFLFYRNVKKQFYIPLNHTHVNPNGPEVVRMADHIKAAQSAEHSAAAILQSWHETASCAPWPYSQPHSAAAEWSLTASATLCALNELMGTSTAHWGREVLVVTEPLKK